MENIIKLVEDNKNIFKSIISPFLIDIPKEVWDELWVIGMLSPETNIKNFIISNLKEQFKSVDIIRIIDELCKEYLGRYKDVVTLEFYINLFGKTLKFGFEHLSQSKIEIVNNNQNYIIRIDDYTPDMDCARVNVLKTLRLIDRFRLIVCNEIVVDTLYLLDIRFRTGEIEIQLPKSKQVKE